MENLIPTNNSLRDIVDWLKAGHIICLFTDCRKKFFFKKNSLPEIKDEILIYIYVKNESLLNDDEWIWYIKNEGFVEYISIDILPTNNENICFFK